MMAPLLAAPMDDAPTATKRRADEAGLRDDGRLDSEEDTTNAAGTGGGTVDVYPDDVSPARRVDEEAVRTGVAGAVDVNAMPTPPAGDGAGGALVSGTGDKTVYHECSPTADDGFDGGESQTTQGYDPTDAALPPGLECPPELDGPAAPPEDDCANENSPMEQAGPDSTDDGDAENLGAGEAIVATANVRAVREHAGNANVMDAVRNLAIDMKWMWR